MVYFDLSFRCAAGMDGGRGPDSRIQTGQARLWGESPHKRGCHCAKVPLGRSVCDELRCIGSVGGSEGTSRPAHFQALPPQTKGHW